MTEPSSTNTPAPLIGNGIRWQSLDVLRGVAVLLVLIRHLPLSNTTDKLYPGLYLVLQTLQRGGWVGVDLFFVLSGFLVSGILFRQYQRDGQIQPGRFLIRRGFKIYPAFWFLTAVTLLWLWETSHRFPLKKTIVELAFLQNYMRGLYDHTWSLAVEEHCYIGICLLFTLLASLGRGSANPFRPLPAIVITAAVGVLALRLWTVPQILPKNLVSTLGATHLRCDTFLIGTLVGYAFYFSDGRFLTFCRRWSALCLMLGIACLVPAFFRHIETDRVVCTWLFSVNAIGGALLLMGALGSQGKPSMGAGLLATIGEHSYSIYLWHILVSNTWLLMILKASKMSVDLVSWTVLSLMTSIMAGILASYLIERPALKLRDRWFPG
ncbi:MAG: acyltransferase [Planctomycetota bacterium]